MDLLWFVQTISYFRCEISISFYVICFVRISFSSTSSRDIFITILLSSSLLILIYAPFRCSSRSFSLLLVCFSNSSCITLVSLSCSFDFSNYSFCALLLFLDFFNSSNALISWSSQSITAFSWSSGLETYSKLLDFLSASNFNEDI